MGVAVLVFLATLLWLALPAVASAALHHGPRRGPRRARRSAPVVPPAADAAGLSDPAFVDAEAALVRKLLTGALDPDAYRYAMHALASADEVSHPMAMPGDPGPAGAGDGS